MIHIFCTYVYLYLVSYDATVLIHVLCYETQWPGFTPFPPLTLFLLRSSAWSIARMGQRWGLFGTLSLEKVLWQEPWDTSVVVYCRPQEPSSPRKHSLAGSWPRASSWTTLFVLSAWKRKTMKINEAWLLVSNEKTWYVKSSCSSRQICLHSSVI